MPTFLVVALATAGFAPGAAAAHTVTGGVGWFPAPLDPQLSWSLNGWEAMYDTYIPLLTYRHADGLAGSEVVPGLARSLPRVTDGGRRYTLHLRPGLRYSDGEPVRASDFRFAVERMFRLGAGGSFFYDGIVGAERFELFPHGHISGITTDDATGRITIRLVRPDRSFSAKLALLFVAPVPPGTPLHNMSHHPPPATGPYMITHATPHGWTYRRNPEWSGRDGLLMPGIPSGHLAKLRMRVVPSVAEAIRQVTDGKLDWMSEELNGSTYKSLRRRFPSGRVRLDPSLNTYYFWMNTTTPPFNDVRVRRAINYAVDRRVFSRSWGGQMRPTAQILPRGLPGYRRFDLYPHDMKKARRLIAAADPSVRDITIWTEGEADYAGPLVDTTYYASVLKQLGFTVHIKVLDSAAYFDAISEPWRDDLDTGIANYFADYPDPDDFLRMTIGARPTSYWNENYADFFVPSLYRTIERLNEGSGPAPEGRYAVLDRHLMREAPWVPYGSLSTPLFVSRRIDLDKVVSNPTFGIDLTSLRR